MKSIVSTLNCSTTVNDVYWLLSKYLQSKLKHSVFILLQLDEKQNESYVFDLVGLRKPLYKRLIKFLGLNPVGKRYKNTPYGKTHFFSANQMLEFDGDLYDFSGGVVPEWICKLIESHFNINEIFTIGINHEEVLIGSVLVFPRQNDKDLFPEIENVIPLFSQRMRDLMNSYKLEILGTDVRDRYVQAIINNISHEIRTPLNGIVGLMDAGFKLLKQDENTKELSKIIWENSVQLTHKLDNLLLVSNLESGLASFNFQYHKLSKITNELGQIAEKNKLEFVGRNILLNVCVNNLDGHVLCLDLHYFKIAINELLNNALKFSEKNVVINVKGVDRIIIEICDEGMGMSGKEISEYLKAFNRTKVISEKHTGMGIGLGIVKHIVQRHEWQIAFRSVPLKKTKVTLDLGLCFSETVMFDPHPSFDMIGANNLED